MKTRHLLLAIAVMLAAGGLWVGRAAWRVHRQVVTLDLPNAPLAVVLRKIEWQVWKKIRTEESLANVHVTLHVKDTPLPEVLDRLAEQAGARWNTLYAVYRGKRALKALDSALQGDGKLDPAGWTQIAPNPATLTEPAADQAGPRIRHKPGATPELMPDGPPDRQISGAMMGRQRGATMMLARQGPNGPIIFQGGPNGEVEMWSPQELLMEASLSNRLGNESLSTNSAPTTIAAAQTARKVSGRWTTYLAFHKSGMHIGFRMPRGRPKPGQMPPPPSPNLRFTELTPQQRVQRVRQHLGINEK